MSEVMGEVMSEVMSDGTKFYVQRDRPGKGTQSST